MLAVLLLAACKAPEPPAAPTPPVLADLKARATIQQLMVQIVDPSADALWDAVSTEVGSAGMTEKQPRTDAQWQEVRRHAVLLAEAANLLQVPGRQVAHAGATLEDAQVPGISSAAQIEQAIGRNPAAFAVKAQAMHAAASDAIDAVDARDVPRLLVAGAKLDQACERCHVTYWYPGAAGPPAQWPAPLKQH